MCTMCTIQVNSTVCHISVQCATSVYSVPHQARSPGGNVAEQCHNVRKVCRHKCRVSVQGGSVGHHCQCRVVVHQCKCMVQCRVVCRGERGEESLPLVISPRSSTTIQLHSLQSISCGTSSWIVRHCNAMQCNAMCYIVRNCVLSVAI